MTRLAAGVLVVVVAAGCAAKLPPDSTFRISAWSPVERITPGARVEVAYVTGNPPLRHAFEGTFLSASATVLEIATKNGRQRLLPQRVLRVGVGGRENRTFELATTGFFGGAIVGMLSMVDPPNDSVIKRRTLSAAFVGGALGFALGVRRGDARPTVVYERERR